jgi:hypothetical protein
MAARGAMPAAARDAVPAAALFFFLFLFRTLSASSGSSTKRWAASGSEMIKGS